VKPLITLLAAPALFACVRIPRPVRPGDVPADVRVRVIAPDLPPDWWAEPEESVPQ
jgi:hypothetical protein